MDEPKIHSREEMAREQAKDKPVMKIGLIGHAQHGKTSVAAAITKFYGDPQDAEDMRPDTIRGIQI